jgi:multimeric flavodoxin WrbA
MSMKVILVNGSPHKSGCTFTALNEVAKSLNDEGIETDIFWIGNRPIGGCINCKMCEKNHKCVFDDKVNEFLKVAKDYDGFIFGSPVHWASAGGAITSFMDRVFYADLNAGLGSFRLKPAAAVANARRAGTTATLDQLNKYFGLMQMPIISSRYWNMTHGFTPEEVRQDLEGMQVMRVLGRNMAFFLKCKKMAMEAGLPLPEPEEAIYTNFIRDNQEEG